MEDLLQGESLNNHSANVVMEGLDPFDHKISPACIEKLVECLKRVDKGQGCVDQMNVRLLQWRSSSAV